MCCSESLLCGTAACSLREKFNKTKLHRCFLTEKYTRHDTFTSASSASLCEPFGFKRSHGHGINEVSAWCSVYGVPIALFMSSVQAAHWIQESEKELMTNDIKWTAANERWLKALCGQAGLKLRELRPNLIPIQLSRQSEEKIINI